MLKKVKFKYLFVLELKKESGLNPLTQSRHAFYDDEKMLFSNFQDEACTVNIADFHFRFVAWQVSVSAVSVWIEVFFVNFFNVDVRRKKGIKVSGETLMILMLNAFVIGILVEKIAIQGFSFLSTTGLLG